MIDANVIAHSRTPTGEELITVEIDFHRFILAEINTHRVLSRNYQSSRAVPVPKMLEQVRHNPAIPVHFGKNQAGMVAEEENDSLVSFKHSYLLNFFGDHQLERGVSDTSGEDAWRIAAKLAAYVAESMHDAGYHKQIVNRIIEPYVWTKGVITATIEGWESVFKLRCHKDAQPEFRELAEAIREEISFSIPTILTPDSWHLPYYGDGYWIKGDKTPLEDAIKISTSCCAQVSYRVLDDSLEKAKKIYDMLNLPENGEFTDNPPHFSPAEHVAMVTRGADTLTKLKTDDCHFGGNFQTKAFYQYRKMLEQGVEQQFINRGQ